MLKRKFNIIIPTSKDDEELSFDYKIEEEIHNEIDRFDLYNEEQEKLRNETLERLKKLYYSDDSFSKYYYIIVCCLLLVTITLYVISGSCYQEEDNEEFEIEDNEELIYYDV